MIDDLSERLAREIEAAWDALDGPSTRDERIKAAVAVAVAEAERMAAEARREALEEAEQTAEDMPYHTGWGVADAIRALARAAIAAAEKEDSV